MYIGDMKCNVTREYKLHELRQGRNAFAGDLLFKGTDLDIILDYARSLRGLEYCVVVTDTQVMTGEAEDGEFQGDTLTYTESQWAPLYRSNIIHPFQVGKYKPFSIENYALVEVRMTGDATGGLDHSVTLKSGFSAEDMTALLEYTRESMTRDALIAVFGSPHVKADRENIHQIHRVEEKADDLLNELAHKLKGGEYYGH